MKKLLHERLREIDSDRTAFLFDVGNGVGVALDGKDAQCLADEIERYYTPRPRFEDGEPADAKLFDKEEAFLIVYADGSWKLEVYGEVEQQGDVNTPVKRPVFDAEGERIRKGDTVWDKKTGELLTVDSPLYYTKEGTVVTCKDGAPGKLHYKPEDLTHREPDSLTKLQQFAVDSAAYAEGCEQDKFMEIADRLTALIERGA